MGNNLLHIIDSFAGLDVVVLGEAILDSYLEGSSDRLCREAPVPVISIAERKDVAGGAANCATNVRAMGGRVRFLSVVGEDDEGARLRSCLQAQGVSAQYLLPDPGRRTLTKHRVVADQQILLRFDQGTTDAIAREAEERLLATLEGLFLTCDAFIISDYRYGIYTPRVIERIATLQRKAPRIIVADSKTLERFQDVGLTAIKPNYKEAVQLLGLAPLEGLAERAAQVAEHGERALLRANAQIAAITLDTAGALIFEQDRLPYRTYARPRPNSRATGAGDTFVSALALALAAGAHTPAAAELASAAAAVVVAKDGTATCSAEELRGYVSAEEKYVRDVSLLDSCVSYHKQQGKRIVFTNGCFDILHRGHITYLSRAKALGDVLVVGVNADESVRRLKGPRRPINSLEDRVQVLTALSCVDYVVPFGEDTPIELLHVVRPDLFVKGGDYTFDMLPEAPLVHELGGEVKILDYLEERSTSGIIDRIREAYAVPLNGHALS